MFAVDECLNGTAHMCFVETTEDGRVDGKCQDLLGSLECICPDGYEFDSAQGGCTGKYSSCSSLSLEEPSFCPGLFGVMSQVIL